jgi:hypothetical protein
VACAPLATTCATEAAERPVERVPLDWATTQENLGILFLSLVQKQAETDEVRALAALKAARDHYAAALEVYEGAKAEYYLNKTRPMLERIDAALADNAAEETAAAPHQPA